MKENRQFFEPVQRGIIENFDKLEILLRYLFEVELGVGGKQNSNINLLMTEIPGNSKETKKQLCDLMFDRLKVSSFALMNTAVLSLFSTGRTTGLVAECGHGLTNAVPVFEGYALPHAIHTMQVAGQDITDKLMHEIIKDDKNFSKDYFFHVRQMKEQMCHVAYDYEDEVKSRDDCLNQE